MSPLFSYGFKYHPGTKPGSPVLVYLPGGPGGTSMEEQPNFLPEGWGYLLTDPRGIGCNTLQSVPDSELFLSFFRTKELAADVTEAVIHLNLQNYIVYGISYGTMLGTQVVSELEQKRITPPKAVIFEGVLGRAFREEFVGEEFINQWESHLKDLPLDVLSELKESPEPFGITTIEWSRIITSLLPGSPNFTTKMLSLLSNKNPIEARTIMVNSLKENFGQMSSLTLPEEIALYKGITCREISDTVPKSNLDVVFKNGKLIRNSSEEGTMCLDLKLNNPFDSAKFQFNSKVYYFIGEDDVATPKWQGEYHFQNHRGSAVKIVTLRGGHNSLTADQETCTPDVMNSIADGGSNLDQILSSCPKQVQAESKLLN